MMVAGHPGTHTMPPSAAHPTPLDSLPPAAAVHRRLGELVREERLRRRRLRLALDRARLRPRPAVTRRGGASDAR
jgi:hypothetical protein